MKLPPTFAPKGDMFSKTCEYALRSLIFIARRSRQGVKVGIVEIAKNIGAPEKFIAKILHELTKHNLVQSQKGPTGGFYLDEQSLNNSLADVVRAVDGDKLFFGCGLGLDYCSEKKPCPIHFQFKKIREDLYKMLEDAKVGELQEQLEEKLAFLTR
jgi:Rrf2 family protein